MRLRVLGVVLAGMCHAAVAGAASLTLSIDLAADCPTPASVRDELVRLLPDLEVRLAGEDPGGAAIIDAGASYRVAVGLSERTFLDENRRCDERARVAAGFIVSALEPPRLTFTQTQTQTQTQTATQLVGRPAPVNARQAYPASSIDRPLILPRLMAQASTSGDVENIQSDSGESFAFGLDLGLSHRVQAGVYFAIPVHPNPDFGTFLANVQVGLHRLVNLRLDVGVERLPNVSILIINCTVGGNCDGSQFIHDWQSRFQFGVGLPFKWKFHRMFALVSGSTTARGFGIAGNTSPNALNNTTAREQVVAREFYSGNAVFSDSIFTVSAAGTTIKGSFHLPIGLLFQPHPVISLTMRTGYLMNFAADWGVHPIAVDSGAYRNSLVVHRIPLAVDLVINPARALDLGFTFELPGAVATTQSGNDPIYPPGYGDIRIFSIWAQGRI